MFPGFPERLAGLSKRLAGLPERLAGLPERLAGPSETLAGLPETLASRAETLANFPETLANPPERRAAFLLSIQLKSPAPRSSRGGGEAQVLGTVASGTFMPRKVPELIPMRARSEPSKVGIARPL